MTVIKYEGAWHVYWSTDMVENVSGVAVWKVSRFRHLFQVWKLEKELCHYTTISCVSQCMLFFDVNNLELETLGYGTKLAFQFTSEITEFMYCTVFNIIDTTCCDIFKISYPKVFYIRNLDCKIYEHKNCIATGS